MEFNKLFDHTLLKAFAKEEEIKTLCEEAIKYDFMSVCVNPCNVEYASKCLEGSNVLVCTVIGFPLGASTTEVKAVEAMDAIKRGAKEIDMVINVGKAKEHNYAYIEDEIKTLVSACAGNTLKVIIETCYLTDEEKIEVCLAAKRAGATFVKTSTGFGTGGATVEDIALMRKTVGEAMGVKASGGVHSLEELKALVDAGASRIGASASVKIMEEYNKEK